MNTFVYLYLCYESHNSSNLHENTENMLQNKYHKTQYKSSLLIMILNTDIQLPDQRTKLFTKSGKIKKVIFSVRKIPKTDSYSWLSYPLSLKHTLIVSVCSCSECSQGWLSMIFLLSCQELI